MSDPPMYLLIGPQELLLRRAADKILEELQAGGELDLVDVRAADLASAALDLRTQSLFGTPRAVLVREAHELPAGAAKALLAHLEAGSAEALVILLATGSQRIQGLAKRIKDVGGRVDVKPPAEWDERGWARLVAEEFRRHGRSGEPDAVAAVLDHAGSDLPAIVEKVAQAVAAAPAGAVTAAHVEQVVTGLGNRGTFAVADAMCERKPQEALTLLRGALEAGQEPVMVLGGLAYRLRSIVAVGGEVEEALGFKRLSDGQRRRLRAVRDNFGPGELTSAFGRLAEADRLLKGSELPPQLVLERAVVEIATRR